MRLGSYLAPSQAQYLRAQFNGYEDNDYDEIPDNDRNQRAGLGHSLC